MYFAQLFIYPITPDQETYALPKSNMVHYDGCFGDVRRLARHLCRRKI